MTNAEFKQWLKDNEACLEAREWIKDRDEVTAWQECERPDWMLWLASRRPWATIEQVKHSGHDCAQAVAYLNCDPRVQAAIDAGRKAVDAPTDENINAAEEAAEAARAAARAAWAARAAAMAAEAAEAARAAARAAAWAAWAARAAAWAADAAWADKSIDLCAIIRKRISGPLE
jgi:hypothetical protein